MRLYIEPTRYFSGAYRTLTLNERINLKAEIERLDLSNCIIKHVIYNGWLNGCSTYFSKSWLTKH